MENSRRNNPRRVAITCDNAGGAHMPLRAALGNAFGIVRSAVRGFFEDDALSHSAAMAFYAATSLAPILLIVIAVAGLAVGRDAAQLALSAQLSGLTEPP